MISVFKVKIPQNNKMSTLTSVDQILKTRVNSAHKGPFLNNPSSFTSILEICPPVFNIFHLFITKVFHLNGIDQSCDLRFHCTIFLILLWMNAGTKLKICNGKNGQFTSCTITKALDTREAWCTTCSILNSRLSLLRRIKPFLNHHCALRFFNSCIYNLYIYRSIAWGNCSNYLSRLLFLQKRAARLLLDADFSQPSVSLFSKLKFLKN